MISHSIRNKGSRFCYGFAICRWWMRSGDGVEDEGFITEGWHTQSWNHCYITVQPSTLPRRYSFLIETFPHRVISPFFHPSSQLPMDCPTSPWLAKLFATLLYSCSGHLGVWAIVDFGNIESRRNPEQILIPTLYIKIKNNLK